jgi:hypothetical protein
LSVLRTFFWSFLVTVLGVAVAFYFFGPGGAAIVLILGILEVSFSFDNAVINATVLKRMSAFWQKIFLTVGVLIAVFGMRLIFPFLLVSGSAGISPWKSVDISLSDSDRFEHLLRDAHPIIAAFGGIFLLMIFLDFIFEERDFVWLQWLEKPLAKIGKLDQLSVVIGLGVLVLTSQTLAPADIRGKVLLSGVLGLFTYLLVNGLGELFDVDEEDAEDDQVGAAVAEAKAVESGKVAPSGNATGKLVLATGKAAFFLFLYLEVLDASFSFDGVVGAFAVTNEPFVIALGLGIGAMYVRSLTVYLVNRGTLDTYVYLEHGAHWAIGVLAVILMITMKWDVPEVVTGLIGVVFIAASLYSSIRRNKKIAAGELTEDEPSGDRDLAEV